MKKRSTVQVLAIFLAYGATLPAAFAGDDWMQYGRTDMGSFFWKPTNARKDALGNWDLWIKHVPTKPRASSSPRQKGKFYVHSMTSVRVSCSTRRMTTTSAYEYDAKGNVIHSGSWPDQPSQAVIPETIGEQLLDTVCPILEPNL